MSISRKANEAFEEVMERLQKFGVNIDNDDINGTMNSFFEEVYDEGYERGESDGYYRGFDEGREEGAESGFDEGFYEGFSNGSSEGFLAEHIEREYYQALGDNTERSVVFTELVALLREKRD